MAFSSLCTAAVMLKEIAYAVKLTKSAYNTKLSAAMSCLHVGWQLAAKVAAGCKSATRQAKITIKMSISYFTETEHDWTADRKWKW